MPGGNSPPCTSATGGAAPVARQLRAGGRGRARTQGTVGPLSATAASRNQPRVAAARGRVDVCRRSAARRRGSRVVPAARGRRRRRYRGERSSGGDLRPARLPTTGRRVGGGASGRALAGRDPRTTRAAARVARPRRTRRAHPAANTPHHHRLELRPAHRGRATCVRPAVRLRRRLDGGRRGDDLRRRRRHAAGFDREKPRPAARRALRDAPDNPRVRGRAAARVG